MNKNYLISAILLTCLLSFYSHAENKPLIKVSAQGQAKALPDQALVQLNFMATELDAESARQNVNSRLKRFLKELDKYELESQSLDTSQINVYPQYDYYKNKRELRGFQVSRQVSFKLNQLNQLEDLVKLMTQSKVDTIQRIEFHHSNEALLKDEALSNAIRNATRLAETIAEGFNVSLNGIYRVTHHSDNKTHQPAMLAMSMRAETADNNLNYEQKPLEYQSYIDVEFNFN